MQHPARSTLHLVAALLSSLAAAWAMSRVEWTKRPAVANPSRHVVDDHFPDGQLHIRREVVRLSDGTELNDGQLTVWYPDGQRRSCGTWRQGKKHGPFEHWHPSGARAKRVHYEHGLAHGPYAEWDEQGRPIRDEIWRRGKRVSPTP